MDKVNNLNEKELEQIVIKIKKEDEDKCNHLFGYLEAMKDMNILSLVKDNPKAQE